MTATWHQDGIDLFLKMTAGLETISHYGVNMSLYYTDADFSWPDYQDDWTSRTGNVVTVQRTPLCATGGTVTSMRGVVGKKYAGWTTTEYLIEMTGIGNAVVIGETAKPKMTIEFTR